MSSYEAGKDMERFTRELQVTQSLVEQLYNVIEHNLKTGAIKEPPKKKQ